jgi:hypothetical protein
LSGSPFDPVSNGSTGVDPLRQGGIGAASPVASPSVYWPELQPVVGATYRLLSEHDSVSPDQVIGELGEGTDPDHVHRALAQLYREGYIGGLTIEQQAWPYSIYGTEKGLQHAAGWPREGAAGDAEAQAFLRLLDERIAAATSEKEAGVLRRVRDAAAEVGTKLLAEVLSSYLARMSKDN